MAWRQRAGNHSCPGDACQKSLVVLSGEEETVSDLSETHPKLMIDVMKKFEEVNWCQEWNSQTRGER